MHSAETKRLIRFDNVTLGYGKRVILKEISFAIHEGDYFGIVGPNGSGKTTILRAVLGTLRPLSGTVEAMPQEGMKLRFGYVPQRDTVDNVVPYSVHQVVMMGRYRQIGFLRRPGSEDRELVRESLKHVGIEDLGRSSFKNLSGGQKQRVLIARALAAQPNILILDEPTNGMDLNSRWSILSLISKLHSEDRLTVIMVSHMLDDVANHVKRIALVEKGFFQVGSVDEVLTAENLSKIYGMDVRVSEVHGKKSIVGRGDNGHN